VTGPAGLDPYALVRAAGMAAVTVPERTIQPDPTPEIPNPAPLVIPGGVRIVPDLDALPDFLKGPDGQFAPAVASAVLWQLFHSLEIRAVTGHVVLTSVPGGVGGTIWQEGRSIDFPITWDQPAPAAPTGVLISTEATIQAVGRTVAVLKDGSATTTGAVITATNIADADIIVNTTDPLIYHAQGLYLHTPILDLEQ
jgi:hypothetical protein